MVATWSRGEMITWDLGWHSRKGLELPFAWLDLYMSLPKATREKMWSKRTCSLFAAQLHEGGYRKINL